MREFRTSGSVGAAGGRLPAATRPPERTSIVLRTLRGDIARLEGYAATAGRRDVD